MIDLNLGSSSSVPTGRPTRRIRLPVLLSNERSRTVSGDGITVHYGPTCSSSKACWHSQGVIVFPLGKAKGNVTFWTEGSPPIAAAVRSRDVWFVAPRVRYTGEWEYAGNVLLIFLEPWRLQAGLGRDYLIIAGSSSIDRVEGFLPLVPGLRKTFDDVRWQLGTRPEHEWARNDIIMSALYAALFLWQFHIEKMRVHRDGEDLDAVMASAWHAPRPHRSCSRAQS